MDKNLRSSIDLIIALESDILENLKEAIKYIKRLQRRHEYGIDNEMETIEKISLTAINALDRINFEINTTMQFVRYYGSR